MKSACADEKLGTGDYRIIALCVLICAASLVVGTRYFYKAFPEASIDFRVNKDSSLPIAARFLAEQETSTAGYMHAASFRYDEEAKVFMERELGLAAANKLMGSDVRVWRWGHRWFKPLQKEEISVEITPHGELAGFAHMVPEDSPGADLPPEAARSLAESFLELTMKRQVESLEFLDSQTEKRPYRTDHVFIWKVPGLDLAGATYRISVTVQGERVDGYSEYLKVPEEWSRSYARLRSLNEGATQVDVLFFALLGVAMIATLLRRLRSRDVRWKTAFLFAVVACVLQFLASLNEYPLALYEFDTTGSYSSFLGRLVLFGALGALSYGGIIFLLTACAEPAYRASNPSRLSISRMLTWSAIRTRAFLIASVVGVTLTFFFFAYEIGFYLLANRFGAWAPADIPYTELLNTRFPWIFVLLGGFFPAVSEEWTFRAFSIPYLSKLLRRRWVAVVVASFIWGFGHANYPNQPFFIRGLEVGVVGLVLSWAMLRFGIIAPLIAHYSIDAFYSAFLLLRSGNPYLVSTGAITAGINLVPLLIAAGAYVATRRFLPAGPVMNSAEQPPSFAAEPAPAEYPPAPAYSPLPGRRTAIAFALLGVGTVLLFLRAPHFGDFVEFRASPAKAEQASIDFLSQLKFRLDGFTSATQPVVRVDDVAAQYVYRAGGIEALNRIYRTQSPAAAWQTRFFRPLQKEEFRVNSDPSDSHVISFAHELPEEAAGADLQASQAQTMAASFLSGQGYDLALFELKETRSEKPRNRRDWNFTWEARSGTPGAIGEARVRVQAGVFGNRLGLWTDYINTPEEWKRSRESEGWYALAAGSIQAIFITVMFAYAVLTLARGTRRGLVRWGLAARLAAVAAGLQLLESLNSIPGQKFVYDTAVAVQTAVMSSVVESLLIVLGIGIAVALTAGLMMSCYPECPSLLRRESRNGWKYDASISAVATLGLVMMLHWIVGGIQYYGSRIGLVPSLSPPENIATFFPLLSAIRDVFLATLLFSAVVAFAIYLWRRLAAAPWTRLMLIAGLLGSFLPADAKRLSEAALGVIPSIVLVTFVAILAVVFLRGNYLAYIASAACVAAARSSSSLLGHGNSALTVQGAILWAVVLAWLVLAIVRSPRTPAAGEC